MFPLTAFIELMNKETVLITGASSGIGLELARVFARHHHPLILTARDAGELLRIASELKQEFGVPVYTIARDLEDSSSPDDIATELAREGLPVQILVNNAGLGYLGAFWNSPIEQDLSMLRVNIGAMVRLTKIFLPDMIRHGSGRILNTASIASFEPGPNLAVYHATKAFVLSLSEALATELEVTGITVTALCPGPTDTDFFPKAGMTETRAFQEAQMMPPQEVARIGYEAAMRGERVVVTGVVNKLMVFSRQLIPEAAQAKKNERMYEKVPFKKQKRVPGEVKARAELKV
jgi:short-subunit dehydrogenase